MWESTPTEDTHDPARTGGSRTAPAMDNADGGTDVSVPCIYPNRPARGSMWESTPAEGTRDPARMGGSRTAPTMDNADGGTDVSVPYIYPTAPPHGSMWESTPTEGTHGPARGSMWEATRRADMGLALVIPGIADHIAA